MVSEERISLRLTSGQRKIVEGLADKWGVSDSEVIRRLVDEAVTSSLEAELPDLVQHLLTQVDQAEKD